jgi:N-acetylmuramoyl-L-alanine amidase
MGAVYLAAGHGGNDPGSSGNGLVERELNAAIARVAVLALRRSGVKTYTDLDVGNPPASATPNQVSDSKKHPDVELYVEVHHNAFGSPDPRGIEVYGTGTGVSMLFGKALLAALFTKLQALDSSFPSRGYKEARGTRAEYAVVQSQGSSALVECLFITSSRDSLIAKRADYAAQVGETLARATVDFGRARGFWTSQYVAPGPAPTDPCAQVKKDLTAEKAAHAKTREALATANQKLAQVRSIVC